MSACNDVTMSVDDAAELSAIRDFEHPETFGQFVGRVAPKFSPVPKHLHRLYSLIERSRHEQIFATVSMPPRHGKTTSFSLGYSYRIAYDPACNNYYTTYGDKLATAVGLATMRIVETLGVPLDSKRRATDDWGTIFGGGLVSTSKGGQITGRGANGGLVVADDLIKGHREARSKAARDDAHEYVKVDLMSRAEGGSSVIVMNTRWHDDDVIARIKKDPMGLNWIHINMPAIHDEHGNPIDEREFPELAHPLWLGVDAANKTFDGAMRWYDLARKRGEAWWWAVYQGVPRGEKMRVFSGNPARYNLPRSRDKASDVQPFDWDGKRGAVVMDPAATDSTKADFTAIGVVAMDGRDENAKGWVVDAHKEQMTVPAAARLALDWKRRYRLPLVVEQVGAFKAVGQIIDEIAPSASPDEPPMFGDKYTRAQPAASAWNDGRLMVPNENDANGKPLLFAPWIGALIEVVGDFTGIGDEEDDVVDMISHGWNYLKANVKSASGKWKAMARALRKIR